MLVEKKKETKSVVAIKLTTGEEIIATLLSDDDSVVMVKNPLAMVLAENPENPQQTRVMFTPWMVAADHGAVSIKNAHVVALTSAREDAVEQYENATKAD
jgi:citrate synthase